MTTTQSVYPKAHTGRRIAFTRFRDLPNGPQHQGIITGINPDEPVSSLLIRLDGTRRNLHVRPNYEGLTYLDEVVPVPDLPMGAFTPVANDMNGFHEHAGVLVTAVGEDGENLVVLTDDKDEAYATAVGYGPDLGFDPDYFDREDMQARWVVFEWEPEDSDCSWVMNPAAQGDDHAVHVYYLPTA